MLRSKLRRAHQAAKSRVKEIVSTRLVDYRIIRYELGFGFGDLYHPFVTALQLGSVARAEEYLRHYYSQIHAYITSFSHPLERVAVQHWKHGPEGIDARFMQGVTQSNFMAPETEIAALAAAKAAHLFAVLKSVEEHGYSPRSFGASPIRGVWVNENVLMLGGQHRAAVLYHLGVRSFSLRIKARPFIPGKCRIEKAERLPLVKAGYMPPEVAKRVLTRIHTGFSRQMAESMNLIPSRS